LNFPGAIETQDVVLFEWSIGCEIERVFGGDGGYGTGLLIAFEHDVEVAKVAICAQDFAFSAFIASEDPKTIRPAIVDDVVDVTDGSRGKAVSDLPSLAAIGGGVDVNFGALAVVEIFTPVNVSAGDNGDVEWPGAASNFVRRFEFAAFGIACCDCSGDSRDHGLVFEERERVEAVTHEPIS